jgi:hypothetical protein
MGNIQYISPSAFYYWEKCPLQAVLAKQFRGETIFPKHPDADLGSLIHKFYEKQNEWNINTVEKFNAKWHEEISAINTKYKNDNLQKFYYPIQWHSKYYAVKKKLLCTKLISKEKKSRESGSIDIQYLYEQWISNNVIGGKIDLQIIQNGEVKQVVDFKTGNIYEKRDQIIEIKESYKQQLALYCAIILEKQNFIPELFIETIDGIRVKIEIDRAYINELINKASLLKVKINDAINGNKTQLLSNCNSDICPRCNYRPYCNEYKSTLINKKNGVNIDIKGKIVETKGNELTIDTGSDLFVIKKIKRIDNYKINSECEVYNLYFPENEENLLYETINTVVKYAE